MPRTRLTDLAVTNLKPTGKQATHWDVTVPGFGLRVSQAGAKSWVVMTGRGRKLTTLSRYPALSLKEARTAAKKLLTEVPKPNEAALTFAEGLSVFLAKKGQDNRARTVSEYRRLLNRHFLSTFKDSPMDQITTSKVMAIVDGLADVPSEQRHAFVAARTFFRFCVSRRFIPHSPLEGVEAIRDAPARERVLTDQELGSVLPLALSEHSIFHQIVLMLLFTGMRRTEAGAMRWEWIDQNERMITLPASITKNKRTHTFPYGQALADLLVFVAPREGHLFPGRDDPTQFFNGWSKSKVQFDKKCAIAPWTLHDLRRTFATNLAALGTPIQVTERLLNHVSGTVSGVAAIYNRHSYVPEMRTAISAWENKLKSLVRG